MKRRGAAVSSGGDLQIVGGVVSGSVISSGGQVEGLTITSAYGQWSAGGVNVIDGATVRNGANAGIRIDQGGSISGLFVAFSPFDVVNSGGVADGTVIGSGGGLTILGGVASGTVVGSGGELLILDGAARGSVVGSGGFLVDDGVASGTVVNHGGTEKVDRGGIASGTVVSGGGSQTVLAGGVASDTTVMPGGVEFVSPGGTTRRTLLSGGSENIWRGAMRAVARSAVAVSSVFTGGRLGAWSPAAGGRSSKPAGWRTVQRLSTARIRSFIRAG